MNTASVIIHSRRWTVKGRQEGKRKMATRIKRGHKQRRPSGCKEINDAKKSPSQWFLFFGGHVDHLRIWYKIYILSPEMHQPNSAHGFKRSRMALRTILLPHVNPRVMRTLEQPSHCSLGGGGQRWHRDHGERDWVQYVWHMIQQLKIKPHTKISHTKCKVIDSL